MSSLNILLGTIPYSVWSHSEVAYSSLSKSLGLDVAKNVSFNRK